MDKLKSVVDSESSFDLIAGAELTVSNLWSSAFPQCHVVQSVLGVAASSSLKAEGNLNSCNRQYCHAHTHLIQLNVSNSAF